MARFIYSILLAFIAISTSSAKTFKYRFHSTPVSKALTQISNEHPEINISFIYNELENYTTDATVDTDNIEDAIRLTVSLNPVTITKDGDNYFLESLQHGKYKYHGRIMGTDGEPVEAATVFLLNTKDSVAITYGISKSNGSFSIPCDKKDVIAKISCLSHNTVYVRSNSFDLGTIVMSARHINLSEVSVDADYVTEYSDKTVFIPTSRQKNSSLSGSDLITKMGIPRMMAGEMRTVEGRTVDVFIDFQPADEGDLKSMWMKDVRKVEYYDFPSDPRFMGKHHVVNFIMAKYEYGGYMKGYADQNIFYNTGQENIYSKFKYKNMTYDLRVGFYHLDKNNKGSNKFGFEKDETFRKPQEDGLIKEFERELSTFDAQQTKRETWTSFRAVYQNKKITVSNTIAGEWDNHPHNDYNGTVKYSPEIAPDTDFSQTNSDRINSISYYGNMLLYLPKGNALVLYPSYYFAHTRQYSLYEENKTDALVNRARDNSHRGSLNANLYHWFKDNSTLSLALHGSHTSSKTNYEGTTNITYPANVTEFGANVDYDYSIRKVHGSVSVGYNWQTSDYGGVKDHQGLPSASLSLQYAINKKNRINGYASFGMSMLPLNYRSDVVIQSNPLMSYTGNPNLKPDKRFDATISYSYHPIKMLTLSANASTNLLRDRFGFSYDTTTEGIIRTIRQPLGDYSKFSYGLSATLRLLNNNLMLSGSVYNQLVKDSGPFGGNYSLVNYSFNANYYVRDFYFTLYYYQPQKVFDTMTGAWSKNKPVYYLSGGWANSNLNLRMVLNAFASWSWKGNTSTYDSAYYGFRQTNYQSGHCLIKFCVTYTFGFGLKLERSDEVDKVETVNANILR